MTQERPGPAPGGLSGTAAAFEFAVVWVTLASLALLRLPADVTREQWIAFVVLVPLVAAVHLLGAHRQKHQGSHLSLAPIFAAVLLLPPLLAAAAIAIAFLPEWLRARPPWYIVLFNVANFVGPAVCAGVAFDQLRGGAGGSRWAVAAVVAIAVFLVLHYAVLAVMLRLARGVRFHDTVRPDCVVIDAGLVSLGAAAASLAQYQPGLVVLTTLPLALAYRSLAIPALQEATRVEPKTGLYNVRHFQAALAQELGRAARFDRPLGLLMIDVDHLRSINTLHGHLAGDHALRSVALALRSATREYDVLARFGGDEFCVLLPETDLQGSLAVAERVRAAVEQEGKGIELDLTASVGVAAHRGGGMGPEELIALADRAAYRAKFSGRNAVAIPPEGDPVDEAERVLLDALHDGDA